MMGYSFFRLAQRYYEIRDKLRGAEFADRRHLPLATWQLPTDSYLPKKLLAKRLQEICEMQFEQICAISTIGNKKIERLIELLHRASRLDPVARVSRHSHEDQECTDNRAALHDPLTLPQATWNLWRKFVAASGLQHVPLGRFAPSLLALPREAWKTPLRNYVSMELPEIRELSRRSPDIVRCVLQVVDTLYAVLGGPSVAPSHLTCYVMPCRMAKLEDWCSDILLLRETIDRQAIVESFVVPLLGQLEIDAGADVAQAAATYLGIRPDTNGHKPTTSRIPRDDLREILRIRWPEGHEQVGAVRTVLGTSASEECLRLFDQTRELFFAPADERVAIRALRDGAAGNPRLRSC
jgi:hypothetical protein